MKSLAEIAAIQTKLFSFFFLMTFTVTAQTQNYWGKIPPLTTKHYSDHDVYGNKIELLRSEIKEKLENSRRAVEDKANKMSQDERTTMAT